MATITLKNIPAELHRELKKRAEEHHRSLNKEILATLKNATSGTIRLDPARLEESVRRAVSVSPTDHCARDRSVETRRPLVTLARKCDLRRHKYHLLPLHGFAIFGGR